MIRTPSAAELGLAEPAEMDPEAYQEWLASLQGPNRTWVAGFSGPTVVKAAEISYRQLDYWDRREVKVLIPEIAEATGSGSARIYSFENICSAALMRLLGERGGLTLEASSKAVAKIRKAGRRICDATGVPFPTDNGPLVFDGSVPEELEPFVVMTEHDIYRLAARARGSEITKFPPEVALRMEAQNFISGLDLSSQSAEN